MEKQSLEDAENPQRRSSRSRPRTTILIYRDQDEACSHEQVYAGPSSKKSEIALAKAILRAQADRSAYKVVYARVDHSKVEKHPDHLVYAEISIEHK